MRFDQYTEQDRVHLQRRTKDKHQVRQRHLRRGDMLRRLPQKPTQLAEDIAVLNGQLPDKLMKLVHQRRGVLPLRERARGMLIDTRAQDLIEGYREGVRQKRFRH